MPCLSAAARGRRVSSWALLGAGLLLLAASLGAGGCGSSSVSASRSSGSPPSAAGAAARARAAYVDGDRDNDHPGSRDDPDNDEVFTYGQPASEADRRAMAALLSRYYRIAASGDGRGACALIYPLAAELLVEEHNRGVPSRRRRGCAQIVAGLLSRRHAEIAEAARGLTVPEARVRVNRGWARVRFGTAERELLVTVHRDGGRWLMNVAVDAGPL